MSSDEKTAAALAPSVVRRNVASALGACGELWSQEEAPSAKSEGASLVAVAPSWVSAIGALSGTRVHWIWCQPRSDADPKAAALSQVTLILPDGRYLVEALDVDRRQWVSRESATGGPLVCGLPFVGGPVLLRVRHVGPAQVPDGRDD